MDGRSRARIPYGYRIVNGQAEIDHAERDILLGYFEAYLSGEPMSYAAEKVGLPFSPATYPHLFKRKEYLGTDFYPAIIAPDLFRKALEAVMNKLSPAGAALLRTTLAFTMAEGSGGHNVLPQEAWVLGNMRYSHHQGFESSLAEVKKEAEKYDLEVEVLDEGFPSPLSSYSSVGFKMIEQAVKEIFPEVVPTPYIMTGASDSRFMSRVSDNCLRFAPFTISAEQMNSIHGQNENLDLETLAPAVDFYRWLMTRVG